MRKNVRSYFFFYSVALRIGVLRVLACSPRKKGGGGWGCGVKIKNNNFVPENKYKSFYSFVYSLKCIEKRSLSLQ